MTKPIISVENLSKAYRLGLKEEIPETLAGAVAGVLKAPFKNWKRLASLDMKAGGEAEDILWALKDVSFEVQRGEVVGIIGRNGAGKSTLLKILSRITEPTSGCVKLRGRVSSLLEVGTGFHPELTGRDNIYMNGTILGMRKKEIDKKFDEIVDFSGVEKFLDTPIKRYSSGMKVRLAFAVAAYLEPEILIIDEVLAVGDAEFQKKCLGKMQDVASGGRTVLFVSHNMAAMQNLCTKVVIMYNGRAHSIGETNTQISTYLSSFSSYVGTSKKLSKLNGRSGEGAVRIEKVTLENDEQTELHSVVLGNPITIAITTKSNQDLPGISILLTIYDSVGVGLAHFNSSDHLELPAHCGADEVTRLRLGRLPLVPGLYRLNISISDKNGKLQDRVEGALSFTVEPGDFFGNGKLPTQSYSKFYLDHSWCSDVMVRKNG